MRCNDSKDTAGERPHGKNGHEDAARHAASKARAGKQQLDRQQNQQHQNAAPRTLGEFNQILPASERERQKYPAWQSKQ